MIQNQQVFAALLVNPPQGLVQVDKTCPPREEPLKVTLGGRVALQRGRLPVRPQTLVIPPHCVADTVDA